MTAPTFTDPALLPPEQFVRFIETKATIAVAEEVCATLYERAQTRSGREAFELRREAVFVAETIADLRAEINAIAERRAA